MDIEDQFELNHLFLTERKCRVCGEVKDLIDGFYLIRKRKAYTRSAYSYECKQCTKKRILNARKTDSCRWEYPDW